MRICLILLLILFNLIGILFGYIYLFIFLIGFIYFFLLIISLKGIEKIVVDYCERKKISNQSIHKSKNNILYILFLIIIPFYIVILKYRLFVITNNVNMYFLVDISQREYMSLYLSIIIFILFISTLLIWINILNIKYKRGKYNIFSLFIGIYVTFFFLLSLIMFITGWGIKYLFILELIGQLNIISEILYMLISGDLVQFSLLEYQILPFLNMKWVNMKLDIFINYINLNKLKISNLNINEKLDLRYKVYRFDINKNFYYKSINSGNIIIRLLNRLFTFIIVIGETTYKSYYINRWMIRVNNGLSWGLKLSMIPYSGYKLGEKAIPYTKDINNEGSINNEDNINVNGNINNSKLSTNNNTQNNKRNIIIGNQNIINIFNGSIIYPADIYPINRNIRSNQNIVFDTDIYNNINLTEESNNNKETSPKNSSIDDQNRGKKRKNNYPDNRIEKKKKIITTLYDTSISNINIYINYPHCGIFNIRDISKEAIIEWTNLMNKKEINNIQGNINNKTISTLEELISLPYNEQTSIQNKKITNILENYLKDQNYSMQSRNTVMNYINYLQIQEYTKLVEKFIAIPATVDLSFYTGNNKVIIYSLYANVNNSFYSEKEKMFFSSITKVPKEIKENIDLLLFLMRKYSLILDSNLKCRTLIVQLSEKRFHDAGIRKEKEWIDMQKKVLDTINIIRIYINEKINQAEINNIISKEIKEAQIIYNNKFFALLDSHYLNRFNFLWEIIVEQKFRIPTSTFLEGHLKKWENVNSTVLNPLKRDIMIKEQHDFSQGKSLILKDKNEKIFPITTKISNVGLNLSNKNLSSLSERNFPFITQDTK